MMPAAWLPTMPKACVSWSSVSRCRRPAAGAEAARDGRRMKVPRVQGAGDGEADPAHDLDGRDRRLEHRATRRARRFGQRQRRRHRDAARVHDGVLARVVEVETVGERGVGEHGVGGGHARGAAEQRALGGAAEPLSRVERGAAEVLARRGQRIAERVEGEQHRPVHDGCGDGVERQPGDEAREAAGGRHSSSSLAMTTRWIWLVPS